MPSVWGLQSGPTYINHHSWLPLTTLMCHFCCWLILPTLIFMILYLLVWFLAVNIVRKGGSCSFVMSGNCDMWCDQWSMSHVPLSVELCQVSLKMFQIVPWPKLLNVLLRCDMWHVRRVLDCVSCSVTTCHISASNNASHHHHHTMGPGVVHKPVASR